MAQLNKSFWESGTLFSKRVLVICLFFITMHILAYGQYRVLSWSGDVKIMQGGKFLRLTKQSKGLLGGKDAVWIPNGASVELGFPDGSKKVFKGPRFSRVEVMQKAENETRPSFFAIFFENLDLGKYIDRDREKEVGGTRAYGFTSAQDFYEKLKSFVQIGPTRRGAITEKENGTPPEEKREEIEEALSSVDRDFDAAPPEVKTLLKAKVYKHVNRGKQALETAFNYYETILNVEAKQRERVLLEEFIIEEVLPLVVTYEVDESSLLYGWESDGGTKVSLRFASNFKVWWAAFSFDGTEIKEIEKTIDSSLNPRETFTVKNLSMGKEKSKPCYLFVIATPVWSQLEKYDDIEVARKELLNEKIPETGFNKAGGFGAVIIKIDLSNLRQLSFQLVRWFLGMCL